MSTWKNETDTRNHLLAWVIWAVGIVIGLTLLWVYVVNPLVVNKDAQTLDNSYGAQTARIAAARQAIVAIEATTGKGQQAALTNQACRLIADVNNRPDDLTTFYVAHCG